jgi:hypothetical protein
MGIIFALPALFWLIFYKFGLIWGGAVNKDTNLGVKINTFSLNPDNITIKTQELFFMNFFWIILAIICATAIALWIKALKNNQKSKCRRFFSYDLTPIVFAWIAFIIFQYVYLTYAFARYIMPHLVGLILLLAFLLGKTVNNKSCIVVSLALSIVMFAESFLTVDPVTKFLFRNIDVGETTVVSPSRFMYMDGELVTQEDNPVLINDVGFANALEYNRQSSYFQRVFNEAIKRIEYDKDTLIVVPNVFGNMKYTENRTWINLFSKLNNDQNMYIDENSMKIFQQKTRDTQSLLNLKVIRNVSEIEYSSYERIFIVYPPYDPYYDFSVILSEVEVKEYFQVSKLGWVLDLYQIK